MKNTLTACLPALALLALGGCASTAGLATSEDDGVYYSSKDRTTAVASAAPAPLSNDEAANPDYHGSPTRAQASQGTASDQYYDNTYTYMKGVPTSPGINYYAPYSPYTTLSYAGAYGGAYGFSPYAYGGFYDPFYSSFYSPFYSPFGYGYRSGISIGIGFGYGRSFGYGGYSPFGYGYSPFGYGGYGGFYDPFYSPYYYGGAFYGGYYGRGGYYGNTYNGGYGGGYGYGGDNRGNGRTYGHRTDRASEVRASSAGAGTGATGAPVPAGGGRMRSEMVVQPNTTPAANGGLVERSRNRTDAGVAAPAMNTEQAAAGGFNRPQRMDRADQPQYRNMEQPGTLSAQPQMTPAQSQDARDNGRGRWRNADVNSQANQPVQPAAPQPVENERRRGGFFRGAIDQPTNAGMQSAEQPQRRVYEQPRQQRSYEQPQRTFEQPQQRSYEQPQRTFSQPSQPSYSAPSYGGGGGGGGGGRRGRD